MSCIWGVPEQNHHWRDSNRRSIRHQLHVPRYDKDCLCKSSVASRRNADTCCYLFWSTLRIGICETCIRAWSKESSSWSENASRNHWSRLSLLQGPSRQYLSVSIVVLIYLHYSMCLFGDGWDLLERSKRLELVWKILVEGSEGWYPWLSYDQCDDHLSKYA